jgi:hypothetical protein
MSGENFVCSTTKAAINNNIVFVALFAASFGNEPESMLEKLVQQQKGAREYQR